VDPKIYRAQFATSLRRTDSIRKVLQDIGCNPDILTSTGNRTYYSSNQDNYSLSTSHYDYPKRTKTCFTDEELSALIDSRKNTNRHYDLSSTSNNQNKMYYSTILSNS
ncbi:unnamed protein product, partial [Rotaria sp. Silwood2]